MTDRAELVARIERQIARYRFSFRAPEAILADLETTHVLIDRAWLETLRRVVQNWANAEVITCADMTVIASVLPPAPHIAADSDTPETKD